MKRTETREALVDRGRRRLLTTALGGAALGGSSVLIAKAAMAQDSGASSLIPESMLGSVLRVLQIR